MVWGGEVAAFVLLVAKTAGDSSDEWHKTLGFAVGAAEKKQDASLDKTTMPPKDKEEVLRKSERSTKGENPKR